ncbi:MAG: HD domain-containing phosphohydrolase [Syntrophaceae bacterium]
MQNKERKLESLINIGIEINQIKDLDILMEKILGEARRFVNADAGSIYIREKNDLKFSYTQNAALQKKLPEGAKLIYSRFTIPIDTNSIAGYAASTGETLNIEDVYKLDGKVPYKFSRSFDEQSGYRTTSILTMPLKTMRNDILGVLQIINAQDENRRIVPFSKFDEKGMHHFAGIASMALERAQLTRGILLQMIRMAEMRDPKETGAHVNRVASYADEIYQEWARRRNIPSREIDVKRDILRMAAMLHDVGKVAISDTILKKPDRLTAEEFDAMKEHTIHGARLFLDQNSDFAEAASEVALTHHERWDGKGYPGYDAIGGCCPKKGDQIPLFGRIVAIADVYDALVTRRCYKDAWDDEKAFGILREEAGNQFDPELVEIFFACAESIRAIKARYPDTDTGSSCT